MCKYLGYTTMCFLFEATNLTVYFFILFLCSKVHADAINELHYCGGKMAIMSEMSQKMGIKFDFERNAGKNIGYQQKNAP